MPKYSDAKSLRERYHELRKLPFDTAIRKVAGGNVRPLRAAIAEAVAEYRAALRDRERVLALRKALRALPADVTGELKRK